MQPDFLMSSDALFNVKMPAVIRNKHLWDQYMVGSKLFASYASLGIKDKTVVMQTITGNLTVLLETIHKRYFPCHNNKNY